MNRRAITTARFRYTFALNSLRERYDMLHGSQRKGRVLKYYTSAVRDLQRERDDAIARAK